MIPKPPPTPKEILARLETFLIVFGSVLLVFFLPVGSPGTELEFAL